MEQNIFLFQCQSEFDAFDVFVMLSESSPHILSCKATDEQHDEIFYGTELDCPQHTVNIDTFNGEYFRHSGTGTDVCKALCSIASITVIAAILALWLENRIKHL